jgi:hypothetical protein
MGMFDGYIPTAPTHCPACGKPLRHWQGKDGPCLLLAWQQGRAQPVGHFLPDNERDDEPLVAPYPKGFRSSLRLPRDFIIASSDCGKHLVEAIGKTVKGKWVRTTVHQVWTLSVWRRQRMASLRRSLQTAGLVDKRGRLIRRP